MKNSLLPLGIGLSVMGAQKAAFGERKLTQPPSVVKAAPKKKSPLQLYYENFKADTLIDLDRVEHSSFAKAIRANLTSKYGA